jgi:Family of unknown function (DUF6226)
MDVDVDGYGQVSNPGRYAVLHDAAAGTLAELERRYAVTRQSGCDLDAELTDRVTAFRVERLSPNDLGAAQVTVAFTDFPGVIVRFGRWHIEAFPRCGCDACDETPGDLVESLVEELNAVATGDFSESNNSYRFTLQHGSQSGWSGARMSSSSNHPLPTPPPSGWQRWPSRA